MFDIYIKPIKKEEGAVNHMYLDTKSKVTVGVGNLLSDEHAAYFLPFVDRRTGERATKEEIKTEFDRVKALPGGKLAGWYRTYTNLEISDEVVNNLLKSRIEQFEDGLKRIYNGYSAFPDEAKLGLMDMAFNLGISGLENKFPTFTKHVRARNWAGCAKECHRRDVSESRNKTVEELFASLVAPRQLT